MTERVVHEFRFASIDSFTGIRGQHRALTDGVFELKIDFGPGYRVYYTERAGVVVVLLSGGDKSSQQKDIKTAISLAKGL